MWDKDFAYIPKNICAKIRFQGAVRIQYESNVTPSMCTVVPLFVFCYHIYIS